MKKLFLFLFGLCISVNAMSQSTKPNGHRLRSSIDPIKVYVDKEGKPNTNTYKYWDNKYWFYVDTTIAVDQVQYVRVFIPEGNVAKSHAFWTNSTEGRKVDTADFNKYLYLKKSDYDAYAEDHYPRATHAMVISAITVPLKIHPSTAGHASSLLNANFNAGGFIGYRRGLFNDSFGMTIGGFLGAASLSQNSSTNTAITGTSNENLFALNYGGGVVFDITRTTQFGFVIGWDHGYGDQSPTYIYQNKAWFAVAINFNFVSFGKGSAKQ